MNQRDNIKTSKDFDNFIKYLADPKKQEERKEIYIEKYGSLSIESKAKFITGKVTPFLNDIIELIQKNMEDENENALIINIENFLGYIEKIKKILPESQQEIISNEISASYNTNASKISKIIINYKKEIGGFNKDLFNFIVDSFENEKKDINVFAFNKKLENPDLINLIKNSNKINTNKKDLEDIFISSILSTLPSIKMENLGRIYSYVNCSWAKKDLCDNVNELTKCAKDLREIVLDIQKRPDTILTYDEINERNNNLLVTFTNRINEVCLAVKVVKKNNQDAISVKGADFKPHVIAGSGEPDIFMQDAENPEVFLSVHCTANESLRFTVEQKNDASSIRHITDIKQLFVDKKISLLCADLPIGIKDIKVKKIEEVIIAPSIIKGGNNRRIDGFDELFKNVDFSKREITLVSLYPLLQIWLEHEHYTSELDILNIDKYLMVGLEQDTWKDMIEKINKSNVDKENKFVDFVNNFLIDYLEEACFIMTNHEFKKHAKFNNDFKGVKKIQVDFIKFLPNLVKHIILQENICPNLLTTNSKIKLGILGKMVLDEYKNLDIDVKNKTMIDSLRLLDLDIKKLKKENKKLPNENFLKKTLKGMV